MNTETIAECRRARFADTPFPLVVQRLAGACVTHYRADLMKLSNTYYDAGVDVFDEAMPLSDAPTIAAGFDGDPVAAAVKAVTKKQLGNDEFLSRIKGA